MTTKVFISTSTFGKFSEEPFKLLRDHGIEYRVNPLGKRLTEGELIGFLTKDRYSGIIAGTEPLTGKVLNAAPTLMVISRVGIGVDNIDLEAAKKHSIKVFTTLDIVTDAVAELTMGLILCALRKINLCDRNMRKGLWKKEEGNLFKGKTLGIIGFGRIGQRVAELSRNFGVRIIFYDVMEKSTEMAEQVSLEYVLENSDVITIHIAGKDEVLSADRVFKVKHNAVIINTSRGTAINEDALYKSLTSGRISYAGMDVFRDEPYQGKIKELENVVLTSHVGSYTVETRVKMEVEAVRNLVAGLGLTEKEN